MRGEMNLDNSETELLLFNELRYLGVFCKMHYDLARQLSPQSFIFKFGGFPVRSELLTPVETKKEFDFVNFAMAMSLGKGYHDSLKALAIVKEKYPRVKLSLIGMCSEEIKKELEDLVVNLGLEENVVFTPFFAKQNDLFMHVQKSRFALLPCKLDNISGTMAQSMQLGLPIVVYKTSGTPLLNKEKQCALIAEKGDVEQLAKNMIALMKSPELADTLRQNAREWQERKFEEEKQIVEHLVNNMRAIISNFHKGTQIPQEQLFNPEIDN